MSYCRFSEGDVYMYDGGRLEDDKPSLSCSRCSLETEDTPSLYGAMSPQEALQHLRHHQAAGHKVPQRAINRLQEEIESDE